MDIVGYDIHANCEQSGKYAEQEKYNIADIMKKILFCTIFCQSECIIKNQTLPINRIKNKFNIEYHNYKMIFINCKYFFWN